MMLSVYRRSKHKEKTLKKNPELWTRPLSGRCEQHLQVRASLQQHKSCVLHRTTSFTHRGTQTLSRLSRQYVRRLSADWMNRVNINTEPEASPRLRQLTCWTACRHLRKELPVTHTIRNTFIPRNKL